VQLQDEPSAGGSLVRFRELDRRIARMPLASDLLFCDNHSMPRIDIAPSTLPPGSGASFCATKHKGVVRIEPLTSRAQTWLFGCIGQEAAWIDGALVIRLGYFTLFADAATEAGFTFERDALLN
jgi:hypothetical protein